MQPLARARLDGIVGLAFDIDDTLTTHGRLTSTAYASLCALAEAGVSTVAVTGRPLGWTDGIAATWPVVAAVGENGAGWAWRDERGLQHGYASDAKTRAAQRHLLETIRRDVNQRMPDIQETVDSAARRCDLAFDIGERVDVSSDRVTELVDLIISHGARASVSSVHAHASVDECDKASGIVGATRDALGTPADADRWVFVGDSGNDAAAFAYFRWSVGVANVRNHLDRLPTPPRFITERSFGEGFIELADAILEAR